MKRLTPLFVAGAVLVSGFLAAPHSAAEEKAEGKKVLLKNAPIGVQKTIADQIKGAALQGLVVETEDGKTEYEARLLFEGHVKTLTMDDKGKLLESEIVVAFSTLPEAVRNAITKEAGKGKIQSVEEVTRDGVVTYEAAVKESGKQREVVVGVDGKLVPAKK